MNRMYRFRDHSLRLQVALKNPRLSKLSLKLSLKSCLSGRFSVFLRFFWRKPTYFFKFENFRASKQTFFHYFFLVGPNFLK